jgi:phage pi2 protein 07
MNSHILFCFLIPCENQRQNDKRIKERKIKNWNPQDWKLTLAYNSNTMKDNIMQDIKIDTKNYLVEYMSYVYMIKSKGLHFSLISLS